mgnify:CR=1 FL=1
MQKVGFLMLSWTSVQHFYSTKLKEKLQRWRNNQRLSRNEREKPIKLLHQRQN